MSLTIGSLFSGIGGLELGLERALGARTLWQVEQNPFCLRVLAKHWPEATRHDDVCTVAALPYVDVICGGFPCQDISLAGKGAGIEHGARSGLWREFARIVGETKPRVVVVENVAALAKRGLARVLRDLADLGFVGSWGMVSAASVGAPHLRKRLFVVAAHPERVDLRDESRWRSGESWTRARVPGDARTEGPVTDAGLHGCEGRAELHLNRRGPRRDDADGCAVDGDAPDTNSDAGDEGRTRDGVQGSRGRHADRGNLGEDDASDVGVTGDDGEEQPTSLGGDRIASWAGWQPASAIRRMDDGVSEGVDRPRRRRPANDKHRLHALGNAVVPQVAEVIGRVVADILRTP